MLIPFYEICEKFGTPKGIIHIGAHLCEERDDYKKYGIEDIIWVEANPQIFNEILHLNSEKELVLNYLLSDEDGKSSKFHITNNGQSSSMLELDEHKIHHPWVTVFETIELPTYRMDSVIKNTGIDIRKYDFLNIDVQGAELMVLKGFGNLLKEVDKIYIEVNTSALYKNCALLSQIQEYVSSFGFKMVEISMTEWNWGDAFFIKG